MNVPMVGAGNAGCAQAAVLLIGRLVEVPAPMAEAQIVIAGGGRDSSAGAGIRALPGLAAGADGFKRAVNG